MRFQLGILTKELDLVDNTIDRLDQLPPRIEGWDAAI